MSFTRTTITLPSAKAEQMRAIASHRGMSVPDLLTMWIARDNSELGIGRMSAFVQVAYEVGDDGTMLTVDLNDLQLTAKPGVILAFAEDLERVATVGGPAKAFLDPGLDGLMIERQGNGLRLTKPLESARGKVTKEVRLSISAAIAKEIAGELRGAVAEAP